jgi:cell division protein FtsL
LIATIVTFVTTRIVAVFVTTIVVVATVPSVIVITHGNTITITTGSVASAARQHGDDERSRLILEVKKAGDDVVAKINSEEASCDAQIAQLAGQSRISTAATQAAIDKGENEFHAATAPFVREVGDDEDEFERLSVVSIETEQVFLARISELRVTALGANGFQGVLVTVCQTILVEVQVTITTVTIQSGGD